jgi:hypothetical protein
MFRGDGCLRLIMELPTLTSVSIHIFVGMSIAYTDRRDVAEKNYTDSVVTLIAYLAWLFSRRLTPVFWHLVCTLTRIVWTDLSLTVLICLLLFCIKEGAPSSWKSRAGKAWEESHWCAVVGVTNVSYIIILTIKSQWRELNSMTGTVVGGIWKMPRFVGDPFLLALDTSPKYNVFMPFIRH